MQVTADTQEQLANALKRADAFSPFLRTQAGNFSCVVEHLEQGSVAQAIALARRPDEEVSDVGKNLRRQRSAMSLALGIADLSGAQSFEEVVNTLSDFADDAISAALDEAIHRRTPDAEARGFAVLALGKLGSHELNYSSDVDLLFLFDPQALPLKPREEAGQAAVRIGQSLVELLQKRDADGYVFRVDLRLRPSPEATPIALPVDAAISYYESSALAWERAAFIRARVVAGDEKLGRYFLDAIHPFIWRRSLDFGAIGEIQNISQLIRDHYSQGQAFGPGYDLKRGRGGIREIEFFAQMHQLIHGGRNPGLRAPATLDALAALAEAKLIPSDQATILSDSYKLLRTIEHRLQMVDDQQTHSLPKDKEALGNVARLHGLVNGSELLDLLRPVVERVGAIYDELTEGDKRHFPRSGEQMESRLGQLGFPDAAAARMRIESWRSGRARSLRSGAAMDAFEAMLPSLLEAFGKAPDPAAALNRFDDLVNGIPSGLNFYRLLEARPALAELLATILCHAPALADQLGRRPELLDSLISESAFDPPPPVRELAEEFARRDRPGQDYQLLLDRVRRKVNEWRFSVGTQLITGRTDPVEAAAGYARIAEAAIQTLADATIAEFEEGHGRVPGSELLILGLGRLGGEGLTHASDLDLVYLFTGDFEAQSDGAKPLGATDYYNRLAKRVTASLSVPTAAGPLYDVDTRLRPSGANGLLAVSLSSFEAYQRNEAWTWEHMALTRGRPVYGSLGARRALAGVVLETLSRPRDDEQATADAVRMRADMEKFKALAGPLDIKLGKGGLVDLEFAVHTLQLRHRTALKPRLEEAIADLVREDLVPAEIIEAHYLLARMLITMRLVSPSSSAPPEASQPLVARACRMPDWESLLAAHDDARQRVSELWRQVARL